MYGLLLLISLLLASPLSAQGIFQVETGSRNFIVRHHPALDGEMMRRLVDQLESDYREFRYYFNLSAAGRTPVIVHDDVYSFARVPHVNRWEFGTVYNDEIHLAPLRTIRGATALSVVVTQQVVRLILYSRRMNGCPRWLYEGAAGYFAGLHELMDPPLHTLVRELSDLDELFARPANEIVFNDALYLSASTFAFMMERFGEANVVTLLRLFNGEFEYDQAIPYSLGVTTEAFERHWRREVIR
jgi:hypothetical protein